MSKDHSAIHNFATTPTSEEVRDLFLGYLYDKANVPTVLAHTIDDAGNMHAAVLSRGSEDTRQVSFITALVSSGKKKPANQHEISLSYYTHPHQFSAALPPKDFLNLVERLGHPLEAELDDDWISAVNAKHELNEKLRGLPRNTLYTIRDDKYLRTTEGEFKFAYWSDGKKHPVAFIPESGVSARIRPKDILLFQPIPQAELKVYLEDGQHIEMYGYLFTAKGADMKVAGALATPEQRADILASRHAASGTNSTFATGDWLS